VNGC
jgi:hypothetical protein